MALPLLLAALAWGQETTGSAPLANLPPKVHEPTIAGLQAENTSLKSEIQRLTTLLNWYQQQFFALQAREIEKQVAPPKPQEPTAKPKEETK